MQQNFGPKKKTEGFPDAPIFFSEILLVMW